MTLTDEETQHLTYQLEEWTIAITVLSAKHKAASETVEQFARELDALRAKYHAATQRLQHSKPQHARLNMWENIGDGG